MTLRLLAYNTDTWLADHLNTYLQDPNEYRTITRSLMHHGGTITYTPQAITVTTLDRHDTPRVNRALTCLIDELNTTPAHMPGDPRPMHLPPRDLTQPRLKVTAYFRRSESRQADLLKAMLFPCSCRSADHRARARGGGSKRRSSDFQNSNNSSPNNVHAHDVHRLIDSNTDERG